MIENFPAEALRRLLGRERLVGTEFADRANVGGPKQNLPARLVDIAGEAHDGHEGAIVVGAVDLLLDRHSPLDTRRLRGGKQPRRRPNLLFRHPGNPCHVVNRILTNPLDERFPAIHIVVHEFLVVQLLMDDDMEHAQGERRIGAGPELQPDIGACRESGQPRIDDDKLCPFVQATRQGLAFVLVRIADHQVVAPDHEALGVIVVVHNGIGAAGDDARGNAWAVAEMAGSQDVWGAEQIGKPIDDGFVFAPRAISHDDGFRPEPCLVVQNPRGNGIQGFIP
jgi:hypothetical protein